jgi:Right handed beta helix region
MSRLSPAVLALSLMAAAFAIPVDAAQRAFVSSSGNDANTASGCGLAAPCRSFASAQTVVSDGGEIVALDAAGYGPITVTKNLTITANPGFYAGIAVPTGYGVTIATAGIKVILRGLNINGTGGQKGVFMTDGASLSIENCVISNFSSQGVDVQAQATVRIVDSIIRDIGNNGVYLYNGATATISGSKILGNSGVGVILYGGIAGTTTTAAISDTVLSGNFIGVDTFSPTAGSIVQASVTRSEITNGSYGAFSAGGDGTQIMTLSDNLVTGNSYAGLYQITGAGTTILESLGNNTVRQNVNNTIGTITTVSPI